MIYLKDELVCALVYSVVFKWMGPFLRPQRKAATHYGHSYALSVNAKCEKPFGHRVKIFGVL